MVAMSDEAIETTWAKGLFNRTWELLETVPRTADEDAEMVHAAHASCLHWSHVGTPVNVARGEWQCSRVYAVLGRSEPALFHARRCLALCEEHDIGDFDLAFAYEALARASAVAGDPSAATSWAERGRAAAERIEDDEDRSVVLGDLATALLS
jgi:creatinine amidohydrolase/Fe(II)-dependent formamide hydrolase-like protein